MKFLLAATIFCTLYLPPGGNYVINTAHYAHVYPQDGEYTWSASIGMWMPGPAIVSAGGEGHPIGYSIQILGGAIMECGEIPDPNRIFNDGFETGDLSKWFNH